VPTIYDVAGIIPPKSVDGIRQRPFDGVSFRYTFKNTHAASRHRIQVFEQAGNRAIYKDGWIAAARHMTPWDRRAHPFSDDRWELYDLNTDFSEADDLSSVYPRKLAQLKRLFQVQAVKNQIYPLLEYGTARPASVPSLAAGKAHFRFYPDLPTVPYNLDGMIGSALPDFTTAHRIDAYVDMKQGDHGILACLGEVFYFYIENDRLIYEAASGDTSDVVVSSQPLSEGRMDLSAVFVPDRFSRSAGQPASGTIELFENGHAIGGGRVTISAPYLLRTAGLFNIGPMCQVAASACPSHFQERSNVSTSRRVNLRAAQAPSRLESNLPRLSTHTS
jgi:arylsulfatase